LARLRRYGANYVFNDAPVGQKVLAEAFAGDVAHEFFDEPTLKKSASTFSERGNDLGEASERLAA